MSDTPTSPASPGASSSTSANSAPTPTKASPRGLALTDSAVRRLKQLDAQHGCTTGGLRLAVKGGGCSGLTYVMDWVQQPREKDKVFERDGGRVYVDAKSLLYLGGTVVDYEESLMASGFRLQNPNVKGSCGCGESFSVG